MQVLQSLVFLLSQQAEVPALQHSFLGANGQVLQLLRPKMEAMIARVASDFMRMGGLYVMKRPEEAGTAFRYECAKSPLFLASKKS